MNSGMTERLRLSGQDDALTPESVLATNPLGHALFTKYIAPIVSRPEKAILLDIFQDNDQGAHGYVADTR